VEAPGLHAFLLPDGSEGACIGIPSRTIFELSAMIGMVVPVQDNLDGIILHNYPEPLPSLEAAEVSGTRSQMHLLGMGPTVDVISVGV